MLEQAKNIQMAIAVTKHEEIGLTLMKSMRIESTSSTYPIGSCCAMKCSRVRKSNEFDDSNRYIHTFLKTPVIRNQQSVYKLSFVGVLFDVVLQLLR